MAQGSTAQHSAGPSIAAGQPLPVEGDPSPTEMISTGEAAQIIGRDARTIERWVDSHKLRGGRPRDPLTREPITGSHRWVDARHAVALAVGAERSHLVPEKWRHLLLPQQRGGDATP